MEPRSLGVVLIGVGAATILAGLVVYWGGFSWFGRLPGDIRYEGESSRVFVPLTSMLVLSLFVTLLWNLIRRIL